MEDFVRKSTNSQFRVAYKKVLINDATFRDVLHGGSKTAAVAAMNKILKDQSMAGEIADTIYIDDTTFRPLKLKADYLIKCMSFVFGNLKPSGAAKMKTLSLGTTGDTFNDIEDLENCW